MHYLPAGIVTKSPLRTSPLGALPFMYALSSGVTLLLSKVVRLRGTDALRQTGSSELPAAAVFLMVGAPVPAICHRLWLFNSAWKNFPLSASLGGSHLPLVAIRPVHQKCTCFSGCRPVLFSSWFFPCW